MANQNTDQENESKGCFAAMKDMMRSVMSNEGGCCSCMEKMSGMIRCSVRKESPEAKAEHDAPK